MPHLIMLKNQALSTIFMLIVLILCAFSVIFISDKVQQMMFSTSSKAQEKISNKVAQQCIWQPVTDLEVLTNNEYLNAVKTISLTDAWAGGRYRQGANSFAYFFHWNGDRWSRISTGLLANYSDISAIDGLRSDSVWAAGYFYPQQGGPSQVLIMHWDGNAWTQIPHEIPELSSEALSDIRVIAENNIWAVGNYDASTIHHPFAMHWDGTSWQVMTLPTIGTDINTISFLHVVNDHDIWASGLYFEPSGDRRGLVVHWDGRRWLSITTPTINNNHYFSGMDGTNSNDVWMVGGIQYDNNHGETLLMHWNGAAWSRETSPNPYQLNNFRSIDTIASGYMTIAGSYGNLTASHTYISRIWNHSEWESIDAIEPTGSTRSREEDQDFIDINHGWLVGDYSIDGSDNKPMILQYSCTGVPDPTPTPQACKPPEVAFYSNCSCSWICVSATPTHQCYRPCP